MSLSVLEGSNLFVDEDTFRCLSHRVEYYIIDLQHRLFKNLKSRGCFEIRAKRGKGHGVSTSLTQFNQKRLLFLDHLNANRPTFE